VVPTCSQRRALALIDRLGRKTLLLIGAIGTALGERHCDGHASGVAKRGCCGY